MRRSMSVLFDLSSAIWYNVTRNTDRLGGDWIMAKTVSNKKIYKKIKRTSVLGAIVSFLFFLSLAIVIMIASIQQFSKYVFVSKLENEYETVKYMAELYERQDVDQDTIYEILDARGREYIIKDSAGETIHITGTDTRKGEKRQSRIDFDSDDIYVYQDREIDYIHLTRNNRLTMDYAGLLDLFYTENDNSIIYVPEEDDAVSVSVLSIPVWMSVDVQDGSEELIVKAVFAANMRDIFLLLEIVLMISVLILLLVMVMFVKAISSVLRQRKIVNYFFTDPVTGGRNRMWYLIRGEERLKRWTNRNRKYAVVNLFFVNYENYCICHSLEKGEEILGEINRTIIRHIGNGNMCAHSASSEFALLINYKDDTDLDTKLKSLIAALETIDADHKFSFQAGVSMIGKSQDENGYPVKRQKIVLENAYMNACAARAVLAHSDESGIAYFDRKIVEEQKWINGVSEKQNQALKNEEFAVYYQPKYDPRTSELKGAEALIRWNSPDFGFVTPNRFIPIFEKNGFITEIDNYMLSHVARDQKRWADMGYQCVPVSVNVSRAHFIESDLAEQIRDIVDAAQCPHGLIEIELTESAFFDDKKAMLNTIHKLKSYGFSVSMDDFGSGYSSLNSLKDMPLDVLKLDAEFFRGEDEDNRGEIVVSEAIKLAKNLHMKIVAEGVEIKEQVDFLASEGCDMIQGYYFAKPMPSDDYEKRMTQ